MQSRGFTLVEMVVVIVIVGIVASIASKFIGGPVQGFVDVNRRAELVDLAELALRRMARDIRNALPNSVRVSATGDALELYNVVDAGRYRDDPPPGAPTNVLSFTAADAEFDVIGTLQNFSAIDTVNDSLVIYNLSPSGVSSNAYNPAGTDNRAQLAAATTAGHVVLAAPMLFPLSSPRQRFYVVDTPVTYLCSMAGGTLTRYDSYTPDPAQGNRDSDAELVAAGAASARVVDLVTACNFVYQPGTAERAGLVTLRLQLTKDSESVVLAQQVHVVNAP